MLLVNCAVKAEIYLHIVWSHWSVHAVHQPIEVLYTFIIDMDVVDAVLAKTSVINITRGNKEKR